MINHNCFEIYKLDSPKEFKNHFFLKRVQKPPVSAQAPKTGSEKKEPSIQYTEQAEKLIQL
jgi:hypothetical protein